MQARWTVRSLVLVATLAGSALLQGCAIVTGPYAADRAPVTSHSMVTRYDKRFYNADGSMPSAGGSPLHMPRAPERGLFYLNF